MIMIIMKNPEKSDASNENFISRIVKPFQLILLIICTVVLLITLVRYCFGTNHHTTHHYTYSVCVDSLGVVTPESKAIADSIVNEIQKQGKIFEDKYQYFIEQKSNTQDILTIGSVVLGIIISLVGFFGYSTMQAIEDRAKKIGEEAAQDAFNTRLKEIETKLYKQIMSEQFIPELKSRIESALAEYEGENTALIKEHEKRLNLVEGSVSDILTRTKKCITPKEKNLSQDPVPEYNPFKE